MQGPMMGQAPTPHAWRTRLARLHWTIWVSLGVVSGGTGASALTLLAAIWGPLPLSMALDLVASILGIMGVLLGVDMLVGSDLGYLPLRPRRPVSPPVRAISGYSAMLGGVMSGSVPFFRLFAPTSLGALAISLVLMSAALLALGLLLTIWALVAIIRRHTAGGSLLRLLPGLLPWYTCRASDPLSLDFATVNSLAWSPDGRRIVSGSYPLAGTTGSTVRAWDALTGENARTFIGPIPTKTPYPNLTTVNAVTSSVARRYALASPPLPQPHHRERGHVVSRQQIRGRCERRHHRAHLARQRRRATPAHVRLERPSEQRERGRLVAWSPGRLMANTLRRVIGMARSRCGVHKGTCGAEGQRKTPTDDSAGVSNVPIGRQGAESNRRHQHFQCCALPTELPWRASTALNHPMKGPT